MHKVFRKAAAIKKAWYAVESISGVMYLRQITGIMDENIRLRSKDLLRINELKLCDDALLEKLRNRPMAWFFKTCIKVLKTSGLLICGV